MSDETRAMLADVDMGEDQDIRQIVAQLQRDVEALRNREYVPTESIDFRALDPTTGVVRMIMSAISLLEEFGIQAHFAGFNSSGTPTFYVDADNGGLVGAGGAYTLNELGIKLLGVNFVLEHLATVGSYERTMRQGFVEIGGKPAWQVEYIDSASGTNLFTPNADLETGSLATGFSASTNWAIATDRANGGTYSAKIEQDKTNPLTTNKYNPGGSIAGNSYRFKYFCDANHATGILTGQVLWYNAVPTLLQTDTIHVGSPKYGFYERSVTLIAPAGATQCELKLYLSTAGPAGYYVWVDDISMEAVTKYRAVRFSDDGIDFIDEAGYMRYTGGHVDVPEISTMIAPASARGRFADIGGLPFFRDGDGVDNIPMFDVPNRLFMNIKQEFTHVSILTPFTDVVIGTGGTIANLAGVSNHPGIVRISSSATANSGRSVNLGYASAIILNGAAYYDVVFRCPTTSNLACRMGFLDTFDATAPNDAALIFISGATLDGRTFNGGASSSTGTTYTIAANTWYFARITYTSALVTFELFSEAGALLWSSTLATNIPAGALTVAMNAIKTNSGAADLLDLDYVAVYNKSLIR